MAVKSLYDWFEYEDAPNKVFYTIWVQKFSLKLKYFYDWLNKLKFN